jgi:hypothetical protein
MPGEANFVFHYIAVQTTRTYQYFVTTTDNAMLHKSCLLLQCDNWGKNTRKKQKSCPFLQSTVGKSSPLPIYQYYSIFIYLETLWYAKNYLTLRWMIQLLNVSLERMCGEFVICLRHPPSFAWRDWKIPLNHPSRSSIWAVIWTTDLPKPNQEC